MASLTIKTADQLRDDWLRTFRSQANKILASQGIVNPNVNVGPGTLPYIKATAFAQQVAVAMQNDQLIGDSVMPDTAQDGDLVRFAGNYDLEQKPAVGANGLVTLTTTVSATTPILITAGTQLKDPAGLLYQTTITGSYTTGALLEVEAIDTGSATNLKAGTVLTWISVPAFASTIAKVAYDFTGGSDAEDIEALRVRVLQYLATPPGGGNWSQVAQAAETASPEVQKSFIYPAINGPGSVGVAITSAQTVSYKGRDFDGDLTVLNQKVIPNVVNTFPLFANFIITTVTNQSTDVAIGLDLPNATTASIPGNGSGWLDGVGNNAGSPNNIPFPTPIGYNAGVYTTGYCDVVTATDPTGFTFTVNADVGCNPGTSVVNICWLSKNDWILRTAQATVTGTGGAGSPYTVTILSSSTPFLDTTGAVPAVGDYIFPNSLNMSIYVNSLLEQFNSLGPGQKLNPSTNIALFPRAYRKPTINDSWSSDIGPSILKFIENTGPEVSGVQYLFITNFGLGAGKCPYATNVLNAPYILVPRRLGFYANIF